MTDQLGTPRMIFDKTGSLANTKRHDYLPFGEELLAGQNGRNNTPQGYSADSIRQKFSQKERDTETNLDYFLARYYSSTQGRFTSPDEFTGGPDELYEDSPSTTPLLYAEPTNPQSLNKYHYAYNNPLRFLDPDGHQSQAVVQTLLESPPVQQAARDAGIGVAKALANIPIGIGNFANATMHPGRWDDGITPVAPQIKPYQPSNGTQAAAMVITEHVALFAGLLGGKPSVGGVAIADAETTAVAVSEGANAARTVEQTASTLKPGPFAGDSISARGPQRNFNTAERAANKANFEASGCHTCGTKSAGTKSGNAVLDHQPANALNVNNAAQRLYPQCLACSHRQGGEQSTIPQLVSIYKGGASNRSRSRFCAGDGQSGTEDLSHRSYHFANYGGPARPEWRQDKEGRRKNVSQ